MSDARYYIYLSTGEVKFYRDARNARWFLEAQRRIYPDSQGVLWDDHGAVGYLDSDGKWVSRG